MGRHTPIQWCDSSVNPVMGCDGCELWSRDPKGVRTCYAGLQHERRGGGAGWARNFLKPEMFPGRMAEAAKFGDLTGKPRSGKPWLDGLPRIIFVSDMGDALSESIPFEFLDREIAQTAMTEQGRRHIWIWLTKRPKRMVEFDLAIGAQSPDERLWWPSNLWVETTVTGKRAEPRADYLRQVGHEGTTRMISFEPLLDEPEWDRCLAPRAREGRIHWAIFGGESGEPDQVRPCDTEWIKRGVAACRRHGVAPFVKQMGRLPYVGITVDGERVEHPISLGDSHGGDWEEWSTMLGELMVREMPPVRRVGLVAPVSTTGASQTDSEAPKGTGLFGVDQTAYAGGGH